jgi:hypothetical protein
MDVRDAGLVHALPGIGDREALLSHPVAGGSREGLAIESLIAAALPKPKQRSTAPVATGIRRPRSSSKGATWALFCCAIVTTNESLTGL